MEIVTFGVPIESVAGVTTDTRGSSLRNLYQCDLVNISRFCSTTIAYQYIRTITISPGYLNHIFTLNTVKKFTGRENKWSITLTVIGRLLKLVHIT